MTLKFNTETTITGQQIADAAKGYKGLKYVLGSTAIARSPTGIVTGYTNCYGLLLQIAKDLSLLPGNFDVNLPPQLYGQSQAKSLLQILDLNFDKVSDMAVGDIILMAYKDVDPKLNEPHHVGVVVESTPLYTEKMWHVDEITSDSHYRYEIIHAIRPNGVVQQRLDALMAERVTGVWRIKSNG